MAFEQLFEAATGHAPYDYQQRLAEGDGGGLRPCQSQLIIIPTGLGKTAAVVLAWISNCHFSSQTWPLRVVCCLPMRTLGVGGL